MSDAPTAQLLPLADQFDACSAQAAAFAGLSEAQGRWRPGPNRWSVAECLAHLAATARQYEPGLTAAAGEVRARGRRAAGAPRPGFWGRRLAALMEPGAGARIRRTPALAPPGDVSLADAARAFDASQAMLRGVVAEVDGMDLRSARMQSPVAPVLRITLATALAMLAAHERRHLAQARRVTEAPGFPVA